MFFFFFFCLFFFTVICMGISGFFFHKAGIRVICFKVFMCSLIYSFINIYHFPVSFLITFLFFFPKIKLHITCLYI